MVSVCKNGSSQCWNPSFEAQWRWAVSKSCSVFVARRKRTCSAFRFLDLCTQGCLCFEKKLKIWKIFFEKWSFCLNNGCIRVFFYWFVWEIMLSGFCRKFPVMFMTYHANADHPMIWMISSYLISEGTIPASVFFFFFFSHWSGAGASLFPPLFLLFILFSWKYMYLYSFVGALATLVLLTDRYMYE